MFIAIIALLVSTQISEVRVFNKFNGTSYTAWQWFSADDTIKNYIGRGKIERVNAKIEVFNK